MRKYMITFLVVLLMTGCSSINNTKQDTENILKEIVKEEGTGDSEYISVNFESDEIENLDIWKQSSETKYCVLDYSSLIDLLNSNSIDNDIPDEFEDKNSYYMTVITKDFSMGLEHHEYNIEIKDDVVKLKDTYTWGATGDKYGTMLIIKLPTNTYSLEYINDFIYEDYN